MRSMYVSVLALLLLLAAGGCAAAHGVRAAAVAGPDAELLYVENESAYSVNIYALRAGTRVLLGRVGVLEGRGFAVPASLLAGSDVRLVATRPGSPHALVSEPIGLTGGAQVRWRLMDTPGMGIGPSRAVMSFTPLPIRGP